MAPVRKTTVEHFTHPGHSLTYISSNTKFLCDGCKKLGNGNRYRCGTCDFDLHEYCCTCPTSLASFMHPMHQLTLVVRKPHGFKLRLRLRLRSRLPQCAREIERVCDVCGTCVNGLFYRCRACEFDVHPLCTQLPQHTRHPLHVHHVLRLQPLPGPSSSGWCMGCKTTSRNAWGYTCGVCDFDIHLKCFNSAPGGSVCLHSGSGSGLGLGSGSGSRSSCVSSLARGFVKGYQNLSSGQSDGGGDEVYATIVQWTTSTWLSG